MQAAAQKLASFSPADALKMNWSTTTDLLLDIYYVRALDFWEEEEDDHLGNCYMMDL